MGVLPQETHQFERIDPNEELHNLGIICEEDLSPFIIKRQEANHTVICPDVLALVAPEVAVGIPPITTNDGINHAAAPPPPKKIRISTDLPTQRVDQDENPENNLFAR